MLYLTMRYFLLQYQGHSISITRRCFLKQYQGHSISITQCDALSYNGILSSTVPGSFNKYYKERCFLLLFQDHSLSITQWDAFSYNGILSRTIPGSFNTYVYMYRGDAFMICLIYFSDGGSLCLQKS